MPAAGTDIHVLMLAENADQHIAKQAASLSTAGYQVSTLVIDTLEYPEPADAVAGHQQIFHVAGAPEIPRAVFEADPLLCRLCAAPVSEMLDRFDALATVQRDLRFAFRLRRLRTALHWSSARRRENTHRFRALRREISEMILARADGPVRIVSALRNAIQMRRFCDTARDWQARLEASGPPRVIHAHDLYTLAAGAVLADRYGARLIYDAHEYEPERTPVLSLQECGAIELFEDRALAGVAGIQTVSGSIAQLYRQRFPDLPVNLAMNCPALAAAGNGIPGLRARTGLGDAVPLAVFVGLPELEGRGLGIVLQAMRHLPDLHLAVIGPRWAKQDAELTEAVRAAGLETRVHLLDPVAPGDVILAIRDADFSVCLMQDTSLNHRFALPNKLFESMLAGVPVLVSDLPDMSALVRRLGAGLVVDQTDIDAVVRVMGQVLADRDAFAPRGEGRAAVEAVCSWEGQEQALLAFYADISGTVPDAVIQPPDMATGTGA